MTLEPAAPTPVASPRGVLETVLAYLRVELAHLPASDRDELLALAAELVRETEGRP